MKMPKPFRYSKYRMPRYTGKPPKSSPLRETEVLTGTINGEDCSDLEERFAIALDGNPNVETFEYQPSFMAARNMAGEIRPDFIVYAGGMIYPIQVDGVFTHQSAEQKGEDDAKDMILDEALYGAGAAPTQHISGEFLQSIPSAIRTVREIFG